MIRSFYSFCQGTLHFRSVPVRFRVTTFRRSPSIIHTSEVGFFHNIDSNFVLTAFEVRETQLSVKRSWIGPCSCRPFINSFSSYQTLCRELSHLCAVTSFRDGIKRPNRLSSNCWSFGKLAFIKSELLRGRAVIKGVVKRTKFVLRIIRNGGRIFKSPKPCQFERNSCC